LSGRGTRARPLSKNKGGDAFGNMERSRPAEANTALEHRRLRWVSCVAPRRDRHPPSSATGGCAGTSSRSASHAGGIRQAPPGEIAAWGAPAKCRRRPRQLDVSQPTTPASKWVAPIPKQTKSQNHCETVLVRISPSGEPNRSACRLELKRNFERGTR
jgi:hypothetical protein